MTQKESKIDIKNHTQHDVDIIVIGAGPAGLAFCRSMADSSLKIALVDPNTFNDLKSPMIDGREVSIIRHTERLLTQLGVWQLIADHNKHPLKTAKVFNGNSHYSLDFKPPNNTRQLLGYFVPNEHIRKALFQSIQQQENLVTYFNNKVIKIDNNEQNATVMLSSGQTIKAQLVVSADSRYSEIRKTMGISTKIKDFGRNITLFRMKHTQSNHLTAMECFHYGRTMAVLPLGEYMSSIVVTTEASQSQKLLDLDNNQIQRDVMDQLNGQLGEMTLVSKKYSYPLFATHATKFHATRYALIGDTAVGMHPVTAQGFNLGMQSQSLLAKAIKLADEEGKDIGNQQLLTSYTRQHQKSTILLYHGTNTIVSLFTNEHCLAKPLRHAVLRTANHFLPFKYFVNRRLTG